MDQAGRMFVLSAYFSYYARVQKFFQHKLSVAISAVAVITLFSALIWGDPYLKPSDSGQFVGPAATSGTEQQLTGSTSTQPFSVGISPAAEKPLFQYIEVTDGCGPYWAGICVNMRSGPGTEYPIVGKLRTGVVLKVASTVTAEGRRWYKIKFDEGVRYPERVTGDWYVAADFVELFTDKGDEVSYARNLVSNKRILIDISEQMLYAFDDETLFMKERISTGLEFTPTPKGTFIIFKKTPSRYMQGPIPEVSDQYYDLPGVPWDLYFTYGGAVIHGAYWHDHFGEPWSHGCVNLPPQKAKQLYYWADIGTPVTVRE